MLTPIALPALFSPAECARIVALAEAAAPREARLVGGRRETEIRRARIAWLEDDQEGGEAAWILDNLLRGVAEANRERFRFDIEASEERAQAALYDGGEQGGFDWHSDIGDGPLARRRKMTLVTQLSDPADYDGGALEVNAAGHVWQADRGQGSAAAFPAFALHRVAPVSRGRRWSLTLWAHGPEFR